MPAIKYNKREAKTVEKLNKEYDKLKLKLERINKRIADYNARWEKRRSELRIKQYELRAKQSKIEDGVVKRCKHKGGTHLRYNPRDDIDYTHRVICDDCGEQIGYHGTQTPYG